MSSQVSCESEKRISIIRGQDKEFYLRFLNSDTKEPFDLTGATPIKVQMKKEDDTTLDLTDGAAKVVVVSALGGKIKVVLNPADSTVLAIGEEQDIEVEITKAGKVYIVQFLKSLEVVANLF